MQRINLEKSKITISSLRLNSTLFLLNPPTPILADPYGPLAYTIRSRKAICKKAPWSLYLLAPVAFQAPCELQPKPPSGQNNRCRALRHCLYILLVIRPEGNTICTTTSPVLACPCFPLNSVPCLSTASEQSDLTEGREDLFVSILSGSALHSWTEERVIMRRRAPRYPKVVEDVG